MLSFEEFGKRLLRTQDLDPVYVALAEARLPEPVLHRLCLAYWCFYHLGVAAYVADSTTSARYWTLLETAARNVEAPKCLPGERWPRSSERRHFRGAQAMNAVAELQGRYRHPEQAVETMCAGSTFQRVSNTVQGHRGFGPWIAFKIADMSERVLRRGTSFDDCELGIYKDPRQGLALVRHGDWQAPITAEEVRETVAKAVAQFRRNRLRAPPYNDRLVNVQEVETIACKYKSYVKGHYYVGKDISEVRHALQGWGDLACQLQQGLPPEVSRG